MEAPVYPAAAAYAPPSIASYRLSASDCSVGELIADPAAWAIVIKHMPAIAFIAKVPQVQPQLGNMTIPDFGIFSTPVDPEKLAALDAELARLPARRGKDA
jgi:hypothetical protein